MSYLVTVAETGHQCHVDRSADLAEVLAGDLTAENVFGQPVEHIVQTLVARAGAVFDPGLRIGTFTSQTVENPDQWETYIELYPYAHADVEPIDCTQLLVLTGFPDWNTAERGAAAIHKVCGGWSEHAQVNASAE